MKFKVLFIVLFFTSSVFSQSDIYYLKDSSANLTYEKILKKEFKPLKKQILDKYSEDIYWLKIPAYKTDSKYIIRILYDRIQNASVYQNSKKIEMLPNQRYLSYRFSRDYDVYIKVDPKLHSYIPIDFDTEEASTSKNKNQLLLNGFYYGFAFLIIIYNLFYYVLFKDDAFLYYSLFLASMTFGLFIMDGMFNFYNISEWTNDLIMIVNYALLAFFSSKFANSYLFLDRYYPKLKKFSYSLGIAIVVLGFLYLNFKNYYYLLFINVLLFSLFFIYWFSAVLLFKKNVYTKILAFAYVIVLFSGIDFFILKFLGISFGDIDPTNIKIGGFLEMIILSIAVLYRMKTLKEENNEMRNEIIKFSTEIAKQNSSKNKIEFLSLREREIFDLIVSIKTNKEIANQLNVSVNTVKFHIKNIYEKLEIKSRKEVLSIAESTVN
jgi:DNA-binding CsgD family transcriptional regulator